MGGLLSEPDSSAEWRAGGRLGGITRPEFFCMSSAAVSDKSNC